jgi:glycosyl transferase, family 25
MKLEIFAINLDRSTERWQVLARHAEQLALHLNRVSAVDGRQIAEGDRESVNDRAFRRNMGRTMLPGEYGCYRSHIKALQQFLASPAERAVIIEDDLQLGDNFFARVTAAFAAAPSADVIKFFSHRVVGFRRTAKTSFGDELGRALHGPLGSAACYGVTRRGAERLIGHLTTMRFPWDVALERAWDHGAAFYTSRGNIGTVAPGGSTIATREIYRSVKFPKWKRFGTYSLRLKDDIQRFAYAFRIQAK